LSGHTSRQQVIKCNGYYCDICKTTSTQLVCLPYLSLIGPLSIVGRHPKLQMYQYGTDCSKGILNFNFQPVWFEYYALHVNAALCYTCTKASSLSLLPLNTKSEETYITKGFSNWRRALEKFGDHEKSACHRHAIVQLQQSRMRGGTNVGSTEGS